MEVCIRNIDNLSKRETRHNLKKKLTMNIKRKLRSINYDPKKAPIHRIYMSGE